MVTHAPRTCGFRFYFLAFLTALQYLEYVEIVKAAVMKACGVRVRVRVWIGVWVCGGTAVMWFCDTAESILGRRVWRCVLAAHAGSQHSARRPAHRLYPARS